MLVPLFASTAAWDESERGLDAGTRSLRDVLARQASFVRGDRESVFAILRAEVRVDPTFAPFARRCISAHVPITVVSSGVESIIRDRLDPLGLQALPIVANEVIAHPAGWEMRFRDAGSNGTDKAAIVAAAGALGRRTIFIGDGRSDYDAALRAGLTFAKRDSSLERFLVARDVACERFDRFADVESRCAQLGVFSD